MSKKYTTNFLEDTNGSTGSANQVLVSTATGIDWVDGSGSSIIGGPYLPLAGGTMTGDLTIEDENTAVLNLKDTTNDLSLKFRAANNYGYIEVDNNDEVSSSRLVFKIDGDQALQLDHGLDATFAGEITINNNASNDNKGIHIKNDTDAYGGGITFWTEYGGTDTNIARVKGVTNGSNGILSLQTANTSKVLTTALSLDFNQNATFASNLTLGSAKLLKFGGNGARIYGDNTNKFLTIDTDSLERMRIDSSGNVGIGISNPVSYGKFVVQGTGNLINANASSGAATFQLYEGGQGRFAITTLNGSAGAKFELAGNEKMRIDSSGNVGIGTTSPNQKLQVGGNLHVYDEEGDTDAAIFISSGTSNTTTVAMRSNGDSFFNGGNVGIGTTSPSQKLEVDGRIRVTTDPTLEVYESSSKRGGFQWDSTNDYTNIFSVGGDIRFDLGNEKMRITTAGNVGIGTDSPSAKLHITKDNTTGNALLITNSGSSRSLEINHNADGTGISDEVVRIMNDGDRLFTIESDGNVGIGTASPGEKLDVNGTVNLTNIKIATAQGTDGQVLTSTGSGIAWEDVSGGSGVTSIASSTVDGKEGIEVTNGSSAAVTVGLDLDLIDENVSNMTHVVGVDGDDKNIKTEKSQFFAYYEQFIGGFEGNGTSTSFTVTHDLGTRYIIQIVDIESTSSTYLQEVYPKVVRTNGTTVDITFKTAPASGHNYEVYMVKINQRAI